LSEYSVQSTSPDRNP